MGIAPERLKRFAGGYGRDLQGVERLFEESEGGLVGEIVNAKIDPIGLFRGKPFFFALLFVGFHARNTTSRLPWPKHFDFSPIDPSRRRGTVGRIPTASFESGTRSPSPLFVVSRVRVRRLRSTSSHVSLAISPRLTPVSIARRMMGGKEGGSPGPRILSRSPFFNRLSRIDSRDHSLNGAFLIGCRRCPSLEAVVPSLHGPSDPVVPKSLEDLRPSAVFRTTLSAGGGRP